MSDFIEIVEVGPRDGLQNEPGFVSTEDKLHFIEVLSKVGFKRIEVASFVSPKWVPQMGDAVDVMAGVHKISGSNWIALVPNMRGMDGAVDADVSHIAIFLSATEAFSQNNLNCSISESFERIQPILTRAKDRKMHVRGYVSCVTDCPFEGEVDPKAPAQVASRLWNLGVDEVALGETLGRGTPDRVNTMVNAVLKYVPAAHVAGHFHDTAGRALANIDVCLDAGLRVFDASAGGLGGCPYAPGAAGNVATKAVRGHVEARGFRTGLDPVTLEQASAFATEIRNANDHS